MTVYVDSPFTTRVTTFRSLPYPIGVPQMVSGENRRRKRLILRHQYTMRSGAAGIAQLGSWCLVSSGEQPNFVTDSPNFQYATYGRGVLGNVVTVPNDNLLYFNASTRNGQFILTMTHSQPVWVVFIMRVGADVAPYSTFYASTGLQVVEETYA